MSQSSVRGCRPEFPPLQVFVYGTLQRGQSNHARCCDGVGSVEDAWTSGRLFDLPWGFPAMQVAESAVLARGTTDVRADWETQSRTDGSEAEDGFDHGRVQGQLLSFAEPAGVLRRLDLLEGYRPDSDSLYERVLLRVFTHSGAQPAWAYVMPELPAGAIHLPAGRWPERGRPGGRSRS